MAVILSDGRVHIAILRARRLSLCPARAASSEKPAKTTKPGRPSNVSITGSQNSAGRLLVTNDSNWLRLSGENAAHDFAKDVVTQLLAAMERVASSTAMIVAIASRNIDKRRSKALNIRVGSLSVTICFRTVSYQIGLVDPSGNFLTENCPSGKCVSGKMVGMHRFVARRPCGVLLQ